MTEERLKEIKDVNSYEYFKEQTKDWNRSDLSRRCYSLATEKAELYNEVVRLREIIDKATDKLYCWGEAINADFQKGMLDILNKSNLTLEQLTGVENE